MRFTRSLLAQARRWLSRLAEPQVLFPLVAVVSLGVVWGTTLNLIGVERDLATRHAGASTVELAETYEAQMLRALREIDQVLKIIRFAHDHSYGAAHPNLAQLRDKGLLLPELLFVVSVTDSTGRIVESTRAAERGSMDAEELMAGLRTNDVLAIGRPVAGGREREPRLHFGRRLDDSAGGFAGMAIVTVPASYFVSGYEASKLGNQGVLGLLGVDGAFRARRSGEQLSAGGSHDFATALRLGAQDVIVPSTNPWDNVRRFTVAREVYGFPVAVIVGLAEHEQLAPVEANARTYVLRAAAGSVALILLLAALGGLSWQLARTRQRANHALKEEVAIRRSAEAALNLRNRAIESSVNAILITDVSRENHPIEYVNPAFERITGYSAAEALGRDVSFLLGGDAQQPALREIERAIGEHREGHAVLRNYRKDGSVFWNEYYTAPVRNEAGEVTHFVGVMNDVTEAKLYEKQLEHQANFDALTGLANRNLLQDRLQQAISAARRNGRAVATVFLDIDHFKLVNDSLGHRVGDELLQEVAARLRKCVRESDTVARLGGDEFVLVIEAQAESQRESLEANLSAVMKKLLAQISVPLKLRDAQMRPTCSIGVSVFPQDGDNADTLLRNADAAMYRAKELGRNRFQLFTADVHERIRRRMELETSLRQALEQGEFELHYQPQVGLRTGEVVGIEALLRWRHPQKGLIGPSSFIAFAEETGLIVPIGAWVLEEACRQNKAWQEAGLQRVPVAVNMSAKQCEQEDIERLVRAALEGAGLDAKFLELEITESISMANPDASVPMMQRLRAMGVGLSIDDFGTGFSNLSYLPRFPIDRLKIDLSFVRQMVTDPGSLAVSEAIISMSHSLKLQVVAEGVETMQQLELLGERHCDSIQGYLFSPPLPPDALARLLAEDRRLAYVPRHRPNTATPLAV